MPVPTIFQRYPENANIAFDQPSLTQEWAAYGTENPSDVYLACAVQLPPTNYAGMYLKGFTPTYRGGGWWDVRVDYTHEIQLTGGPAQTINLDPNQGAWGGAGAGSGSVYQGGVFVKTLDPNLVSQNVATAQAQKPNFRFSAETTGKTIHREQTIQTQATYASPSLIPSGIAPNFGGLIGVTDNNVQGVDVPTASMKFTVTKRFSVPELDPDFIDTISEITGCKNVGLFVIFWKNQVMTFEPGECLFEGATISDPGINAITGMDQIQFDYKFEKSLNVSPTDETPLMIGDIGPITKEGWDYLWVRYKANSNGNAYVKTPMAVYVEQVLYWADFGLLGI